MARLGKPVTDFEYDFRHFDSSSYDALNDRFTEWLSANKVIRFPVADGYAFYLVASMKPLVLRYVLWCDNYTVQDALIRGLRADDVQHMLDREASLRGLFGG